MTTYETPVKAILCGFDTTMVVNIITWNKAYSIFPLITFIQYRGYLLQPLHDGSSPFISKYTRRGWKIQEIVWPEDWKVNHSIQPYRRIGDRYTWTISLDTSKVSWSQTPDYVLEHSCFWYRQLRKKNTSHPWVLIPCITQSKPWYSNLPHFGTAISGIITIGVAFWPIGQIGWPYLSCV